MESTPARSSCPDAEIDEAVARSARLIEEATNHRFRVDYSALDRAEEHVKTAIAKFYEPLPKPPTLRARLSGIVIALLRKLFWWQSLPMQSAIESLGSHRLEEVKAIESVGAVTEELARRLARCEAAMIAMQSPRKADQRPTERKRSFGEDEAYWRFEAAFRGSREEIREKQRRYLSLLTPGIHGTADAPVLDLACGRGEWIELLSEAGFVASGVDTHPDMLAECTGRGLEVRRLDVLECLRQTPSGSLSVVTSFHLVEHLEIEKLVEMIDEINRVLRPGGLCVLETPNPANLVVATQGFYLDPTHVRPLPSALLRYLVESRGLKEVIIDEMNPYPEWDGSPHGEGFEAKFNRLLYGPRDYAVIGRKA